MSYTQLTEKLEIVKDRDTIFVKVGADKIRHKVHKSALFFTKYTSVSSGWAQCLKPGILN